MDLSHLHSKIAKKQVLRMQSTRRVILCVAGNNSILICRDDPATSARAVMKSLADQWRIRGGGSDFYAQGGPYPDEVTAPLNELLQLVNAMAKNT